MNTRYLLPLLACVLIASPARAALLLYDGFDYDTGSVVGDNGGSGFNSAWQRSSSVDVTNVNATGLTYEDNLGQDLVVEGGSLSLAANHTVSGAFRTFSAIAAPVDSLTTYWLSFIGNTVGTTGSGVTTNAALTLRSGANDILAIGAYGGSNNWRLEINNGLQSTSSILSTTQAFVVMRIDVDTRVGGQDTVAFWVNPDLGSTPSLGTAAYSATAAFWDTFSLDLLRVGTESTTVDKGMIIDEFRFGTTYADVGPAVPEPGNMAVLGDLALSKSSAKPAGLFRGTCS